MEKYKRMHKNKADTKGQTLYDSISIGPIIGEFIETESLIEVARGLGRGNGE